MIEVVGFSLIVTGALGNATDRLRHGAVVDFIHPLFIDFPIFNVADSCITIGVIILVLYFIISGWKPEKAVDGDGEA